MTFAGLLRCNSKMPCQTWGGGDDRVKSKLRAHVESIPDRVLSFQWSEEYTIRQKPFTFLTSRGGISNSNTGFSFFRLWAVKVFEVSGCLCRECLEMIIKPQENLEPRIWSKKEKLRPRNPASSDRDGVGNPTTVPLQQPV